MPFRCDIPSFYFSIVFSMFFFTDYNFVTIKDIFALPLYFLTFGVSLKKNCVQYVRFYETIELD